MLRNRTGHESFQRDVDEGGASLLNSDIRGSQERGDRRDPYIHAY